MATDRNEKESARNGANVHDELGPGSGSSVLVSSVPSMAWQPKRKVSFQFGWKFILEIGYKLYHR